MSGKIRANPGELLSAGECASGSVANRRFLFSGFFQNGKSKKAEGGLRNLFDRDHFESAFENEKFEAKLNGLLADGSIVEVSAKMPVSNLAGHVEHWYMDKENGDVFRYVPPEFPAKGIWELVDS